MQTLRTMQRCSDTASVPTRRRRRWDGDHDVGGGGDEGGARSVRLRPPLRRTSSNPSRTSGRGGGRLPTPTAGNTEQTRQAGVVCVTACEDADDKVPVLPNSDKSRFREVVYSVRSGPSRRARAFPPRTRVRRSARRAPRRSVSLRPTA
jgi:hypothetical protein